jgi:DNA-directed RNA polymerase subunit RPC12/RpoP
LKPPKNKSLAFLNPEVAKQWDYEKNEGITPQEVFAKSGKKYHWTCDKGDDHKWQATVDSRWRNRGCPYCSGQRLSKPQSLANLFPELLEEWNYQENSKLPTEVGRGSNYKAHWQCKENSKHRWEAPVSNRSKGSGCPYCAGQKTLKEDSFAVLYSDLLIEYSTDNKEDPFELSPGSNKRLKWVCKNNQNHKWNAVVHARTKLNTGCPYCAGQRATCENNLTFSDNGILTLWDYEKNPNPKGFLPKSSQKVHWRCKVHDTHRWEASIANISRSLDKGKNGCPYCSGKIVNESNSFAAVHSSLLTEWDYDKNEILPNEIYQGSTRKIHWKCPNGPDHEWTASISNRIGNRSKKPTGCPICNGHKCVPSVSLKTTNQELMEEWDWHNNKVNPEEIYPNYNKKLFWICKNNKEHKWKATANKRAGKEKTGCPYCNVLPQSKVEIAIACELSLLFKCINDGKRVKYEGEYLAPDIILPDLKLIIEYDGSYWHSGNEEKDITKTEKFKELGYSVLRVREGDLPRIYPTDICGFEGGQIKSIVDNILLHIQSSFGLSVKQKQSIKDYLSQSGTQNSEYFQRRVMTILKKKKSSD